MKIVRKHLETAEGKLGIFAIVLVSWTCEKYDSLIKPGENTRTEATA